MLYVLLTTPSSQQNCSIIFRCLFRHHYFSRYNFILLLSPFPQECISQVGFLWPSHIEYLLLAQAEPKLLVFYSVSPSRVWSHEGQAPSWVPAYKYIARHFAGAQSMLIGLNSESPLKNWDAASAAWIFLFPRVLVFIGLLLMPHWHVLHAGPVGKLDQVASPL